MRATLLLLDEDWAPLQALGRRLRQRYRIETLACPTAALDRLRQPPAIDAVICDIATLAKGGLAFMQAAGRARPEARRILLCGHADMADALHAVRAGAAAGYLVKPVDAEDLSLAVEAALADGPRRRRPIAPPGPDDAAMADDLPAALSDGSARLDYQPRIDLQTGAVRGVEALLRWDHPGFGAVAPGRLLPAVERDGGSGVLTAWAIRRACDQSVRWQSETGLCLPVSVNISPCDIVPGLFAERVLTLLDSVGCPSDRLELDIAEDLPLSSASALCRELGILRDSGVGIAVEDIGAGYAGLDRLACLPITRLKIDRALIQSLPACRPTGTAVALVVDLARTLGLSVIAEGLETEAQADFLRTAGCDEAQGFLYAPALPAARVTDWVHNRTQAL